jgi:hypothetical protein
LRLPMTWCLTWPCRWWSAKSSGSPSPTIGKNGVYPITYLPCRCRPFLFTLLSRSWA